MRTGFVFRLLSITLCIGRAARGDEPGRVSL